MAVISYYHGIDGVQEKGKNNEVPQEVKMTDQSIKNNGCVLRG
jgi:hypothetical protein